MELKPKKNGSKESVWLKGRKMRGKKITKIDKLI
jgi:hypothetical protein